MTADPDAEWWTTSEVAEYLGLQVGTVSSYRQRGQMPPPDQTHGRTHLWRPRNIIGWQRTRPRIGEVKTTTGKTGSQEDRKNLATRPEDETRWISHGERTIYDNEWVRLSLVDVEPPDGNRFEHHVVTLKAAAMVAMLDDTGERVLLMWRHRFVPDVWNWELPGGVVDEDEDPASTAAREAEEETGYRPRSLKHVVTFEPMIGMVRSPHHVYVAHGAEKVGPPTETTEMHHLGWIPICEIPQLIDTGKICNSGTLIALLHLLTIQRP
jgi:8-oxo-dGTP pyrophosphatase MutT (NUDIX family)